MLGELSGSLAHELNQPLAAILSNAQAAQRFLVRDDFDREELRDILKDIVDEDKRAGEVIQRLRLLLKKGEINLLPLDLNEVVLDVLKIVRSDLVNRDVVADTELAADIPRVMGDRVQVQQVLLNLLTNACDAVSENASGDRSVVVRTHVVDDSTVQVSVIDRGGGISGDALDRIFEPFVTTKSHGMGLGLAVCRTIVTAHGGTLSAANNADRGARFDMTLPTESIS
jgi:C4-dicarboxylate-specific signal transduction histidine kinase